MLAACDFTPLGNRVVIEAMRLCAAHSGAELHIISVAAEHARGLLLPGEKVEVVSHLEAQEYARQHVALLIDDLLAGGHRISLERVAVYVVAGNPSERISWLARGLDADLIVLGTHGRHGLERVLLGSVAEEVLRRAPCGVFVIRPRDFLDGERVPEIQPPCSSRRSISVQGTRLALAGHFRGKRKANCTCREPDGVYLRALLRYWGWRARAPARHPARPRALST